MEQPQESYILEYNCIEIHIVNISTKHVQVGSCEKAFSQLDWPERGTTDTYKEGHIPE